MTRTDRTLRGACASAWRRGAGIVGLLVCVVALIPALAGCARGCTRVVSLAAQHAASEYLAPTLRVATPARLRERAFGPSLRRLRAAHGKSGVRWAVLSRADLNLALAGLIGQRRDAQDDALLAELIVHGGEPFLPDPFGRVPFAVAVAADHVALKWLLPRISAAPGRPAAQVLCGMHQMAGPNGYRTLRQYCSCRE